MIQKRQIQFIRNLIDIDEWKHSHHYDVSKADEKSINTKLLTILEEKVIKRQAEISVLKKGIRELKSMNIIEDTVPFDSDEYNETNDKPF